MADRPICMMALGLQFLSPEYVINSRQQGSKQLADCEATDTLLLPILLQITRIMTYFSISILLRMIVDIKYSIASCDVFYILVVILFSIRYTYDKRYRARTLAVPRTLCICLLVYVCTSIALFVCRYEPQGSLVCTVTIYCTGSDLIRCRVWVFSIVMTS